MSVHSYASSPNLSELMRLYTSDSPLDHGRRGLGLPDETSLPPAPAMTTRTNPQPRLHATAKHVERTAAIVHGEIYPETFHAGVLRVQPSTSSWNSSTQVAKTTAKPLKHQILNRNFVPPAATVAVDRKAAGQLLERLSKGTVSSKMKGTSLANSTTVANGGRVNVPVDVDRKRMHIQKKQATAKQKGSARTGETPTDSPRSGREGIELLLFYRKEVEKRLRADPMYALHQDAQL